MSWIYYDPNSLTCCDGREEKPDQIPSNGNINPLKKKIRSALMSLQSMLWQRPSHSVEIFGGTKIILESETTIQWRISRKIMAKRNGLSLRKTDLPCEHHTATPGECVRVLFAEHVTHSATRDDLQTPVTLPHSERDFCKQGQRLEQGWHV